MHFTPADNECAGLTKVSPIHPPPPSLFLDVLHQIGAQDSFISRRFEKHFVKLTAIASTLGFLAALAFFYALGPLVPDARSSGFLVYLICVPAIAVPFSWQVTRYYVMTSLKTRV